MKQWIINKWKKFTKYMKYDEHDLIPLLYRGLKKMYIQFRELVYYIHLYKSIQRSGIVTLYYKPQSFYLMSHNLIYLTYDGMTADLFVIMLKSLAVKYNLTVRINTEANSKERKVSNINIALHHKKFQTVMLAYNYNPTNCQAEFEEVQEIVTKIKVKSSCIDMFKEVK